ncbi:hypothetical protein VNO78_30947 [Psophocarpus tetragonolobus]|uniref:Uncharacterized protein n=1 Tax=Psophocarpus tetragonolobus TaxID=3891 RepID=A0AAN9RYC0_PSOTE
MMKPKMQEEERHRYAVVGVGQTITEGEENALPDLASLFSLSIRFASVLSMIPTRFPPNSTKRENKSEKVEREKPKSRERNHTAGDTALK